MEDRGHSNATFEDAALAAAEETGGSRVDAVARPRAVIGSEDHQGSLVQPEFAEGFEYPAGVEVNLLDHVAVQAA